MDSSKMHSYLRNEIFVILLPIFTQILVVPKKNIKIYRLSAVG